MFAQFMPFVYFDRWELVQVKLSDPVPGYDRNQLYSGTLSDASDKTSDKCHHYDPLVRCPECHGDQLITWDSDAFVPDDYSDACPTCHGTGNVCPNCGAPAETCPECSRVVKPGFDAPYCFRCGLKPEHNHDVHYARPI